MASCILSCAQQACLPSVNKLLEDGTVTLWNAESVCDDLDSKLQAMAKKGLSHAQEETLDKGYKLIHEFDSAQAKSFPIRWFQRYNVTKKIMALSNEIGPLQAVAEIATHQPSHEFEIHPIPARVVGMDSKLTEVKSMLLPVDTGHPRIRLYGMGGTGKTLLTKTICEDQDVKECFGQHIFFESVHKSPDMGQIFRKLKEHTKESTKFLLILDDVWLDEMSTLVDFVDRIMYGKSAKVLVTSRFIEIADVLGGPKVKMGYLDGEDSVKLLCMHAFPSVTCPADIKELVGEVAQECGGLPLMLKVIGLRMVSRSRDEWRDQVGLMKKAKHMEDETQPDRSFFKRLKLSYDALPTPQLKECFLYLALAGLGPALAGQGRLLYPEDFNLYWEAEGLLNGQSRFQSSIFPTLERYGLVERATEDPTQFILHDTMYDLAMSIINKERRGWFLNLIEPSSFMKCRLRKLALTEKEFQHQSLTASKFHCASHTTFLRLNNRESLTDDFLGSFTNLKVLLLMNNALALKILPKCIGLMKKLVTLDISHNPALEKVPSASIATLYNLKHFDFRDCPRLRHFPVKTMLTLTKLTFIHGEGSYYAWDSHTENATLKLDFVTLKDLSELWVSTKRNVVLPGSIGQLTALKLLHIESERIEITHPSTLESLENLEDVHMLYLSVQPTWKWSSKLKRLRLAKLRGGDTFADESGRKSGLGKGGPKFGEDGVLESLVLTGVVLAQDMISWRTMNDLQHIKFEGCRGLKEIQLIGLTSLKKVEFSFCTGLEKVITSELPNLQDLKVVSCEQLKHVGINDCPALEELMLQWLDELKKLELESSSISESIPGLQMFEIPGCPALSMELKDCHQLRRLWYNASKVQLVSMEHMTNLEELAIQGPGFQLSLPSTLNTLLIEDSHIPLDQLFQDCKLTNLERLGIRNCPIERLPVPWMRSFAPKDLHLRDVISLRAIEWDWVPNLLSLSLENVTVPANLEGISSSIMYLSLENMPELKNIEWVTRLTNLQLLELVSLPQLEQLPDCLGSLPLVWLKIVDCTGLKQQGLPHAEDNKFYTQLGELTIKGTPAIDKDALPDRLKYLPEYS